MGGAILSSSKAPDDDRGTSTPTKSEVDTISEFPQDTKGDPEDQVTHLSKSHKLSRPRLVLLFTGMFLGAFLSSLDISIVATALPRIASDFDAQSQMSWVASAYLLAYTAFQPMYGRLSDIFGRKQMYILACVLFFIGSVGCGAAPSMMALIIFRAVQGFGGSGLFSVVMIMISDMFEDVEERARYSSMIWLAFAVSSVTGPLIGGAFVEHVTWRWCFYINLPFGAISLVLVAWLYQIPFERTDLLQKLRRVDYAGIILVVASAFCLLLPLTWGGTTYAWDSAVIIALFCVFAVLLVSFVFVESKTKEAVIPPRLFLIRNTSLAVFVNCITGACFMGCTFYLPLYFQIVKGASTTNSGLRMMPSSLAIVSSTIISSFLLKKLKDYRYFIWAGNALMTLAIGLFILLDANSGLGEQIAFVLVMGVGQGLIFQNCMLACQECSGNDLIAVATALCGFLNSIGAAIGVAICAAAYNNALARNLAKLPTDIQTMVRELDLVENMDAIVKLPADAKELVIGEFANSFQFVFTVLCPIMGVAFLMSLFISRRKAVAKA
ncbi:hypothetical protein BGZ80_010796 [Entomortierella chlamydospora]|uniref:Major facilitator superfamily (MFS) profile domain-containing protein n=1 Tax=Entomortierella chlamydospora TaxID=101097 RepID=A0A9P6SZH7_9FUNG|nr:hypothetical protein BGZ80_010796 [Entomortierella chlamydospora]